MVTIRGWLNSHKPSPVGRPFPHTHPSPFPEGPFRYHLCMPSLAQNLQHAGLWFHLCPSKGEAYVKTLLERARGSPLTILTSCMDPVGTAMLLPPHTKQIKDVDFENSNWVDILSFSEIDSGPLPFLHTLDIDVVRGISLNSPSAMALPSLRLFSGATGLKEFRPHSDGSPLLNRFVSPPSSWRW